MSDPAGRPAFCGREEGVAKSEEDRKESNGARDDSPGTVSFPVRSSLFATPYFLGLPGGASELKTSLFFSM